MSHCLAGSSSLVSPVGVSSNRLSPRYNFKSMNESLEQSDDEFAQDDLLESPEAPIDFIAEARK